MDKSLVAHGILRWWRRRVHALQRSNQSTRMNIFGCGMIEDVIHISIRTSKVYKITKILAKLQLSV